MVAIQPQSDAPQPKSRWFRFTRPKLLVLTLLLAASRIGLAVWTGGLPPSWTADYGQENRCGWPQSTTGNRNLKRVGRAQAMLRIHAGGVI
jgi:hypothetical protein